MAETAEHATFLGTHPETETAETEAPEVTGPETPSGEEVEAAEVQTEETVETETETEESTPEANVEVLKVLTKKGISENKFNEYLTRYQVKLEEVNANPRLANLLLDKAAADELIAKQKPEEKEEAKPDPPADLNETFKALEAETARYNSPEVVDALVQRLDSAKSTKEQVSILSQGVVNLVKTILAQEGHNLLDSNPNLRGLSAGWQERQSEMAHAEAYEELRGDDESLPEYGSREYRKMLTETVAKYPFLKAPMKPKDRLEAIVSLAKPKVSAETVAEAAEKGKKQGEEAGKKAGLAKGLGAGKSKGTITPAKEGGSYFAEGHALYKERETNNF